MVSCVWVCGGVSVKIRFLLRLLVKTGEEKDDLDRWQNFSVVFRILKQLIKIEHVYLHVLCQTEMPILSLTSTKS